MVEGLTTNQETWLRHAMSNGDFQATEVESIEILLRAAAFLRCLDNAGVDNWDGYSYACEQFAEEYPEE